MVGSDQLDRGVSSLPFWCRSCTGYVVDFQDAIELFEYIVECQVRCSRVGYKDLELFENRRRCSQVDLDGATA